MRLQLTLLVALAMSSSTSATQVTYRKFDRPGCRGNSTSCPLEENTCIRIPQGHGGGNWKSFTISNLSSNYTWASLWPSLPSNCNTTGAGLPQRSLCGECLPSAQAWTGNYLYTCPTNGSDVNVKARCNEDCSSCLEDVYLPFGGVCVAIPKSHYHSKLQNVEVGRSGFLEWVYTDSMCASPIRSVTGMQCGLCNLDGDTAMYHC